MAGQQSSSELQTQWARVRGRLRSEFGEAAFRNWLKKLTLSGLRGSELYLAVPTRFIRDWIGSNYSDRLLVLWAGENPAIRSIELIVEARTKPDDDARSPAEPASRTADGGRADIAAAEIGKAVLVASLDPRFTSRTSSSASRMSWRMPRLSGWRTRRPCLSTRCSSMAVSVSAKPT
jgi:chromosomal replication initiator protein